MNLLTLVVLLAIGLMLWPLWQRGQRAKLQVLQYLRRECGKEGLQLLDDTVQQTGLRWRWNQGRPLAIRTYRFEFSAAGDDRYPGEVILEGRRLASLTLASHNDEGNP